MKTLRLIGLLICCSLYLSAQEPLRINEHLASSLAKLPLACIQEQYPNKTGHSVESAADAQLTPQELHPSFYGCFDWHSSVHGHWMLVRLLNTYPSLPEQSLIHYYLHTSFLPAHIEAEAAYFHKYELGKIFERTYGWAWLLKLDQELMESTDSSMQQWHTQLQPLTRTIVDLWKDYLPKQTYPNRTGVHPNSAFALAFGIDWARAKGDTTFEAALVQKAKDFYLDNTNTPAYLEPDGADFFSPSLSIADLMTRILDKEAYRLWIEKFFELRSLEQLVIMPHVSDRMDYQITHLDGLMLSRAWNMQRIIKHLPKEHPINRQFRPAADRFLKEALSNMDKGNYGGSHWLASFAVYALTEK